MASPSSSGAAKPHVIPCRLTVVETIYHRMPGEKTLQVDSRYSRELGSNEQAYQRRCVATEQWQPLDTGWVEDVGMLVVQNQEGKGLLANPTGEEARLTASRILELAFLSDSPGAYWLIPPGESFRGFPSDHLLIRCQQGTARYLLTAIPR